MTWHRVDAIPDEGRVRTAVVDGRTIALSRCAGRVVVVTVPGAAQPTTLDGALS